MTTDSYSNALTILPNENTFNKRIESFSTKLLKQITSAFLVRKRVLFVLFLQYTVFFYLGACFFTNSPYTHFGITGFIELGIPTFLTAILFVVFLSSFSVFGRLLPYILCLACSAVCGYLQVFSSFVLARDNFLSLVLCTLCIVAISFITILFSAECICFSRKVIKGKTITSLSRPFVYFSLFSILYIFFLYLICTFFINKFMIG